MGMWRALVVAVLLVVAGCGSAESGSGSASKSKPSSTVSVCMAGKDRLLAKADVDGDGSKELILLTKPASAKDECPPTLTATRSADEPSKAEVPLSSDDPPVTSAFAVAPPGQDQQLIVTKANHPRGGYQLRVYAAHGEDLVELTSEGKPLLPFVATDVQEDPWSIDCSADGLVFTHAVAHEPAGIVPAWDIKQTTYALDGTTVTAGPTKEIADNVLAKELGAKYPDLVKHSAFASCRAS